MVSTCGVCWVLTLIIVLMLTDCTAKPKSANFKPFLQSPVMPRIPQCKEDLPRKGRKLAKQTKAKFLLSTMFKDEEGFLAEFVAFYKIHGFDHIILWDHNSADNFRQELLPWTSTGFVEVRNVNDLFEHPNVKYAKGGKYWQIIAMKKQIERENWLWGIKNGYDYYLTADVDEYVLPMFDNFPGVPSHLMSIDPGYIDVNAPLPFVTIADAVHSIFSLTLEDRKQKRGRKMYIPITKYNFNANPHVLEPVDLLTIEAYQTRFSTSRNMNLYMTVQPKFIYRLSGDDLTSGPPSNATFYGNLTYNGYNNVSFTDMQVFHSNCCFFHGCSAKKTRNPKDICMLLGSPQHKDLFKYEMNFFHPSSRAGSPYWLRMNHYARSLEKFALKALTWETANQASNQYELAEYMHRTYGQLLDPSALVYSCLVRAEINRARHAYVLGGGPFLSDMEPVYDFVRRGLRWRRNLEHLNPGRPAPEGNYSVPYSEVLASRIYSDQHQSSVGSDGDWDGDGIAETNSLFVDYYFVPPQ
jgi:hypothetical protein